jgi:cytoskeletal protein CcmA (bactofilin family)
MFSKPSLTKANEPIVRKDVRSVLGSGIVAAQPVAEPAARANSPATDIQPATMAQAAPVSTIPGGAGGTSEARLVVGPDVKLKGAEILDCDTLVVEGRVEATMDSRVIHIAEHGSYTGKVSIDSAEIHGNFEGELTARLQLTIHATGRVSGKIRYGKLVIDEGGELCGDINSLKERPQLQRMPAEAVPALTAIGA